MSKNHKISVAILRDLFGDTLLSYVLACESKTLDTGEWSCRQAEVVEVMLDIIDQLSDKDELERMIVISRILLEFDSENFTTRANIWRKHCGGDIDRPPATTDEFLSLLLMLARDIYPGLVYAKICENDLTAASIILSSAVHGHPFYKRVLEAALADSRISKFFTDLPRKLKEFEDENGVYDIQVQLILSTGRGGGFQLALLHQLILRSAFDRCLLFLDDSLSNLYEQVRAVCTDIRQLALGKMVSIPAAVGLGSISIPKESIICFPWGYVRSVHSSDRMFLPEQNYATALLITSSQQQILHRNSALKSTDDTLKQFEQHWRIFEEADRSLARLVNATRFALLCASRDDFKVNAIEKSRAWLDPLSISVQMSWGIGSPIGVKEAIIDDDLIGRAEDWGSRIVLDAPGLDIAIRRILLAISSRADPIDSFVDAILAWESIFSGNPETSLRVCGAIASLLERADFDARNALFLELKKLYDRRSKIVHGSQEPSVRETVAFRDQAIDIAVRTLKELYAIGDRGFLAKESHERGRDMLLGYLDIPEER